MFGKLDATKKENKGGTGLGLVISNNLVQRLTDERGEGIKVDSVVGQGSTFSFDIEDKTYEMKRYDCG